MKTDKTFYKFTVTALVSLAVVGGLCGCANQGFNDLAKGVLSSTGYVSQQQADSLFDAGGKIIKAATPLTEEQEYFLGRSVAANILSRYKPVNNESVQRYVNTVGRTMAAFSGRPDTFKGYRFLVLDSGEFNAISAPGGFVFITKAFVKSLPDEDALAAVLAHEVAHVERGHGVSAISEANLTQAVTILGKEAVSSYANAGVSELTNLFSESVDEVVETLLTKGYSRSQEYEADEIANIIIRKTAYDPNALRVALLSLGKATSNGNTGGGWSSTHPSVERRVDKLGEVKENIVLASAKKIRTDRFKAAVKSL